MHSVVEELESIVRKGATFIGAGAADVLALKEWLRERQMILTRIDSVITELSPDDRYAISQAFQGMLSLDAALLPVLEQQLSQLGKEITGARKIQQMLGRSVHSHPALILQRSL